MIKLSDLTKEDVGKGVIYHSHHDNQYGVIKSWNDKWIFVVYHCDNQWHRYQDFTGAATRPEDLEFASPSNSPHHWSGWPGAYCLHCGAEDPMEYAVAMNLYNPFTRTWINDEEETKCMKASICPNYPSKTCPQCNPNEVV